MWMGREGISLQVALYTPFTEVYIFVRLKLDEFDYTSRGQDTVAAIYRGVGNSEVRQMVQQYFPEMCMFYPPISSCNRNNQV